MDSWDGVWLLSLAASTLFPLWEDTSITIFFLIMGSCGDRIFIEHLSIVSGQLMMHFLLSHFLNISILLRLGLIMPPWVLQDEGVFLPPPLGFACPSVGLQYAWVVGDSRMDLWILRRDMLNMRWLNRPWGWIYGLLWTVPLEQRRLDWVGYSRTSHCWNLLVCSTSLAC